MEKKSELANKYAEKQRKNRMGTARTFAEFRDAFIAGWDQCEKHLPKNKTIVGNSHGNHKRAMAELEEIFNNDKSIGGW